MMIKLVKKTTSTYWKYHVFNVSDSFQEFTVPSNVTELIVDCVASRGNAGSASAGKGGRVKCKLSVTPLQTLYILVGQIPSSSGTASYNAADIRTDNTGITNTTSLQSRLIVAGGGGSGASAQATNGSGGAGGGLTGGRGGNGTVSTGGYGGTQTAGGARGGSSATYPSYGKAGGFGLGGNGYRGGAGGAGWYGGGGGSGGGTGYQYVCSGGGGGSSYTDADLCADVDHTQGYQNGAGYIRIDYISDSSDYDYTKDETVCYAVKEEKEGIFTYKGVK